MAPRRGPPQFRGDAPQGWAVALRVALRPYRGHRLPDDDVLRRRAASALRQHGEMASARAISRFVAEMREAHAAAETDSETD